MMLNDVLANAIAQDPDAVKTVVDHGGLGFHLTKIVQPAFGHCNTVWTHSVSVFDHGYWHTGHMYPSELLTEQFDKS